MTKDECRKEAKRIIELTIYKNLVSSYNDFKNGCSLDSSNYQDDKEELMFDCSEVIIDDLLNGNYTFYQYNAIKTELAIMIAKM